MRAKVGLLSPLRLWNTLQPEYYTKLSDGDAPVREH